MKCGRCGRYTTLRIKVELFLDIPIYMAHLINKNTIRGSDVRIDGANWPKATVYCNDSKCGWSDPAHGV